MELFDSLFRKRSGGERPPGSVVPSPAAELTPSRWKELLDQAWSEPLAQRLDMTYLGGWYWAAPWKDHRRKVLRVWLQRSCTCGTFQWGWNFDFIPHISGNRLAYRRTNKAVGQELFRVPESYIRQSGRQRERVMAGQYFNELGEGALVERDRSLLTGILPALEEYYQRTEAPEMLLTEAEELEKHSWYPFVCGTQLAITRAFILAAMGRKEEGRLVLCAIPWQGQDGERIRELLLARLERQEAIWTGP